MKPPDTHRAQRRFEARQNRALAQAFRTGEAMVCPTCGVPMDVSPVPHRTDVSYVRDRVWAACPRCHHGAILDRRDVR